MTTIEIMQRLSTKGIPCDIPLNQLNDLIMLGMVTVSYSMETMRIKPMVTPRGMQMSKSVSEIAPPAKPL